MKTVWLIICVGCANAQEAPDIRTVAADLTVPQMQTEPPKPGKRVKQVLPGFEQTEIYHSLYLPTDFDPKKKHPVIFEFSGNGGYRSPYGDESIGRPEGSKLGYGISAGKKYIWVCLPFIKANRKQLAITWWGDAPDHDPQPTIEYCKKAVAWICEKYQGDPQQVYLSGFSRGAIACNYIGLHDDEIAKLWRAFIVYSHYDGVFKWGYPGSDRKSALQRLKRLHDRPQFVCHEWHREPKQSIQGTKEYLESTKIDGNFTIVGTGFRNHNDEWVLRPSEARSKLRNWIDKISSQ